MTALLLAYPLWADVHVRSAGQWHTHHTFGLGIIVPSFTLWATARFQLGSSFTRVAEARSLVTHGLYRHIRHPIYTFGLCVVIGIVVFTALPVLAVVPAALGIRQARRSRREEHVLEEAFGDEYRRYRRSTWF